MPRYAQFVIGPGGCGKSTYCATIQNYTNSINRLVHVINLDPDAEHFDYQPYADIRDLISLEDLNKTKDLPLGPNGGLIYCLEYLARNLHWLDSQIGEFEDDYFIFDCPGQIELYCHLDVMQRIIEYLKHQHNFNICTVFILDCHFLTDLKSYMSSSLIAYSSTYNLACAHVNLMMKVDMLSHISQKKMSKIAKENYVDLCCNPIVGKSKKYNEYLLGMAEIMDDGNIGGFLPLNKEKEGSIASALFIIDNAINYGEDIEVKTKSIDNYFEDKDAELI